MSSSRNWGLAVYILSTTLGARPFGPRPSSILSSVPRHTPLAVTDSCVPITPNVVIISCDGGFSLTDRLGGAAAVGRNSFGQVLSVEFESFSCSSPLFAEARAISLGIRVAHQKSWKEVMVVSDSLTLIQALNSTVGCFHLDVLMLMEDLMASLASFDRVVFSFSPWACNQLAHWVVSSSLRNFRLGFA
ncbi:hypothetical protein HHK36_000201 [Tetracentron sinense]|uniref:RNase H type-1 domain-containing protein n=1 Tax=Tetracentron sinense TaxID=13715 RepID=A0A834ZRT6_TETSI|nr:hypothetical protein HHK36_000201 [Tetracentron sinense]